MKPISYLFFWLPFFILGQNPPFEKDSISEKYLIIVGDTISNNSIGLNEIFILPKLKFTTLDSRRRYLILQRKTIKVYPYAKLASERLKLLNMRMQLLKSKHSKKKYARMVQKFVEEEYNYDMSKPEKMVMVGD